MPIQITWTQPFQLIDGANQDLTYAIQDIDKIPNEPGVYVFSRLYGNTVEPLYIGKSMKIFTRIQQHLKNNVLLMNKIKNIANGQRVVYVGLLDSHKGMTTHKAIAVAERALISAAIVEGHELLNQQGTGTPVYTIEASGNRDARRWWPNQQALEIPK